MICFYHSRDFDGWCSGAIIKYRYPKAKMIGYDYGDPFPFDECDGKEVIMADVSLPMKNMKEIADRALKFVWIDHHISAKKDFDKFIGSDKPFCEAKLDTTKSACEGTWEYCFPGSKMPAPVRLIGIYDVFNKNAEDFPWERAEHFQYGLKLEASSFEEFIKLSHDLFKTGWEFFEKIEPMGKKIMKYQAGQDAQFCKNVFVVKLVGLRALCLNTVAFGSKTFDSVYDESKHDLMLRFNFNGRKWIYSLYTTKNDIDCSEIAKKFGGGGHKKAAGFETDTLLNSLYLIED